MPSDEFTVDPLPNLLFTDKRNLIGALEEVATAAGHTKAEAEAVLYSLPLNLRRAGAAYSRIGSEWVYAFGRPYDRLHGNTKVVGSAQTPSVKTLFDSVRAANHFLKPQDVATILALLGDEDKHGDFLFELAPLLHLGMGAKVAYEVPGKGNYKIEYSIEVGGEKPMLLEVKNRQTDVINYLQAFTKNESAGNPLLPIPRSDPAPLFRNILPKFPVNDGTVSLQGVWIRVRIKIYEDDLRSFFQAFGPDQINFAIISTGVGPGAFVLARSEQIEAAVLRTLGLTQDTDAIVSRAA